MNPGATTRPCASISRLACASCKSPTAAMRSPLTATSPANQGFPAPSMMWPLRMSRSYPSLVRSEEHTSELQSRRDLVCRLLLEKKKKKKQKNTKFRNAHTTHYDYILSQYRYTNLC